MISTLSTISPLFAIIAIFSWFASDIDLLKKPLYLRTGIWRALRWVGTLVFLYGFFRIDPLTIKAANYPMLLGAIAMLIGSARTTNAPKNQKPIFQLGKFTKDDSDGPAS